MCCGDDPPEAVTTEEAPPWLFFDAEDEGSTLTCILCSPFADPAVHTEAVIDGIPLDCC